MNIPEAIFSHKKRKIPQKTASNHYMYAKTYNKGQYLPHVSCTEKTGARRPLSAAGRIRAKKKPSGYRRKGPLRKA